MNCHMRAWERGSKPHVFGRGKAGSLASFREGLAAAAHTLLRAMIHLFSCMFAVPRHLSRACYNICKDYVELAKWLLTTINPACWS